jgi:hypothetical protein
MRTLFAIFITLIITQSALADDACPTIDLEDAGQTAENIPVWAQGDSPYCYVYSASTLATAWIRDNWSKGNSSFISYTANPQATEKAIASDPKILAVILNADQGRTCEALDYIFAQEKALTGDPTHPIFQAPLCTMWGLEASADHSKQIQESPENFETQMHHLLTASARPVPFAIEYCSKVLTKPKGSYITNRTYESSLNYLNDPKLSTENFSKNCGFHSSVVVGQAMRNGSCSFKVRNSWGTSNGNHGDYWVDASDLARNTLRLIELSAP